MVYLTCAVIGLGGRGVIKTWTEVAARVRLYTLTSDLTSLVPPQFSHWLQVRKVGTVVFFFFFFFFLTPARHAQTQYLLLSCYVGVSCSIVVHSHEQVIVADVLKDCCRVAVGLNGFVDLFTVWCQSHHIIAYVVSGHVNVPDVLILLLG